MSNDITALMATMKAAAQLCAQQEPLKLVEYHGKLNLRNTGGIVFSVLRDRDFPESSTENENYAALAEVCNHANVLALVEALEKAQRQNGYLREQSAEWERKAISNFEECAEMSARIEELEAQRKLAFTAGNRWADKFREVEAKLESRTVTVNLPNVSDDSFWLPAYGRLVFREETYRSAVVNAICDAGIQVIEGEGQ